MKMVNFKNSRKRTLYGSNLGTTILNFNSEYKIPELVEKKKMVYLFRRLFIVLASIYQYCFNDKHNLITDINKYHGKDSVSELEAKL